LQKDSLDEAEIKTDLEKKEMADIPRFRVMVLCAAVAFCLCSCAGVGTENAQKASAHYQMGLSLLNDNNIQPAFVQFQKALELNPHDKEVLNVIGVIYLLNLEDYQKAIDYFQRALRVDPQYAEASNNLGFAYEKIGKYEDAIESYKKAASNPLYRSAEKAFNNLGRAYYRDKRFQESISAFKNALRRYPEFCSPYFGLALSYNALDRYEDAFNALKKAIECDPAYKGDMEKARRDMMERKLIAKGEDEKDIEDFLEIMKY
jgi:type IV pilus assembly protein PilF